MWFQELNAVKVYNLNKLFISMGIKVQEKQQRSGKDEIYKLVQDILPYRKKVAKETRFLLSNAGAVETKNIVEKVMPYDNTG